MLNLQDDVRLVVGELATNAVQHAHTSFKVSLHAFEETLLLEVEDGSRTGPVQVVARLLDTNGRGITIVNLLSRDWGVDADADGGKSVCGPSSAPCESRNPNSGLPLAPPLRALRRSSSRGKAQPDPARPDPASTPGHIRACPARPTTTRRTRDMQRIDRAIRRLASQDTARTNASQASAQLRKRRHEQEDVDAYLEALPFSITARDAHVRRTQRAAQL